MRFNLISSLVALILLLSGCGATRNLLALTQPEGAELDPDKVEAILQRENKVIDFLAENSGIYICPPAVSGAPPVGCKTRYQITAAEWSEITLTGISIADTACREYMHALFWFDRAKGRSVDEIGLTAVVSAAIIGLTSGSAETISIVTAALGFAGASVENIGSGLLYDLGPSAVNELVLRSQTEYVKEVYANLASYNTRTRAMWTIRGYAALCLPPEIETEVRRSISNASPTAQSRGKGLPPEVGQTISYRVSDDPADRLVRRKLLTFVGVNKTNALKYLSAVKEAGVSMPSDFSDASNHSLLQNIALRLIVDPANASINASIAERLGV